MTLVDKALWVIERNSDRNLTLGAIADACGVSRSHLASAFGSATDWPVMKYLRRRRLSIAAEALAAGAADILALALETGYGSHEAFTRAFGDAFGMTPEQVRERGSIDGIALIHPAALQRRSESSLAAPRIVDAGTIRAVGLARRHTFDSVIGIPIQWQAFMARGDTIPHRLEVMPSGFVLPADEAESFEYLCAVEVATISTVPEGLVAIELPPRRYAVFEHVAHVSTIFDSYATIWSRALPAHGWTPAEAPAIERHLPTFDPSTGEGGVAIWIPLAEPLPAMTGEPGSAVPDQPEPGSVMTSNQRTIAAYERYARTYAQNVGPRPLPEDVQALEQLVRALPARSPEDGDAVLEIGSGPGRAADQLEALGIPVRRTDATMAFRALQAERGHRVDSLDLVTDEIHGRYAGVLMLAVIQHLERDQVDAALAKLAAAMMDGGCLLMSWPSGTDEYWEHGTSGDYRVVRWTRDQMDARLTEAGFVVIWDRVAEGDEGPWRWVLARKGVRG